MAVSWGQVIDAAGLVPGDVCLIAIGNVIPADVKLLGDDDADEPIQVSLSVDPVTFPHSCPSSQERQNGMWPMWCSA